MHHNQRSGLKGILDYRYDLVPQVTVLNSPVWQINPILGENVTIDNVKIIGHGPNNDGVCPELSKNMLIKNTYFDYGDHCIAIKSGRKMEEGSTNLPRILSFKETT